MDSELAKDIKQILEDAIVEQEERKITIPEPPHFDCLHADDSPCEPRFTKRKRETVVKILERYQTYAGELQKALHDANTKKAKFVMAAAEIEKFIVKDEPVPVVVAPVPVVIAKPAAPAAVPKGNVPVTPARK